MGLGYLGYPLAQDLLKLGHRVKGTTRTPEKKKKFDDEGIVCEILNPSTLPSKDFLEADVLILNIPPFEEQPEWFKSWDWDYSKRIIFVSSTSVYCASSGIVSEDSKREAGILSLEEDFFIQHFPSHMILRAGGILGPGRHPGRILSGRENLSKGNHPVNLIHVDDLRGIILSLIDSENSGVLNVVSDEHHSRKEFYQDFCKRHGLPLPLFDERDKSEGKTVSNTRLKKSYQLKWPTIFGKDP